MVSDIFRGDPNDVISRYIKACEKYGIDVIVRVTGDCPVLSPEIAEYLLDSRFKSERDFGGQRVRRWYCLWIVELSALKEIASIFGTAEYSEYTVLVFTENQDYFSVNFVELPPNMVRDYRLTLDTPEDYEMFKQLFENLEVGKQSIEISKIFDLLDMLPGYEINRQ